MNEYTDIPTATHILTPSPTVPFVTFLNKSYCINEKYYCIPICQGINSPKAITNLYTIVFTEISIFEQMTFMYLSLLSCNCKRIPQLNAKVTQHLVWLSPAIIFNLPQGMMLVHFFVHL